MSRAFAIAICMVMAIVAAWALTPKQDRVAADEVRFADLVPLAFGDWTAIPNPLAQVDLAVKRDERDQASLLFDEVLSRSYRNSAGDIVMLSIAYGRQQRQELKIHRPELCYAAQGFRVSRMSEGGIVESASSGRSYGRSMLAVAPNRVEPVSYWIRIGDVLSDSAWTTRLSIFQEGLQGSVVDGVLVRLSQVVADTDGYERSLLLQRQFGTDLLDALDADARRHLVPSSDFGIQS